jgi:hypothetical protein
MSSEESVNLKQININKIKKEAKEIFDLVEKGKINGIHNKYSNFSLAYPLLFTNIIEKKMSIEEVNILLDTFNIAQNHFIDNYNKEN